MKLLDVQSISVAYGESEVCHDVSFHVGKGEILCVLGRNGVGKTTIIKSIMGIIPARKGKVIFNGKDITSLRPYEIARLGIGYVPQGRMIFPQLTVKENLQSGTLVMGKGVQKIPEEVFCWFPVLKERLSQKGGTLSGGEQQQLAIARCMVRNPDFVLLDEPSEGIQPNIVQRIREIIKQINKEKNITFILVEQNLKFCLDCGTRGYIMDNGTIQGEGDMDTIANSSLIQQYLTFKK
ncbi:MAG: urea ABC transporter ATP-binding subunit UrtE [Candidatus Humimicrobiaceae bacterium]